MPSINVIYRLLFFQSVVRLIQDKERAYYILAEVLKMRKFLPKLRFGSTLTNSNGIRGKVEDIIYNTLENILLGRS